MNRCIFCYSSGPFTTKEHVLPVSLGGGEWAILPKGLLCDSCQNRFGSEVEQQVLNDYPFSFMRVLLGIPRRKRRPPWFKSWEGIIMSSSHPGQFTYLPMPFFESSIINGNKTQIRLLAHPLQPYMDCRFLIKMGIEVVAADSRRDVFDPKFDAARRFALTGSKRQRWWFLQYERSDEILRYGTRGWSRLKWSEKIRLEVHKLDKKQEFFRLSFLYLDLLVPLTTGIKPETTTPREPEFRLFWA